MGQSHKGVGPGITDAVAERHHALPQPTNSRGGKLHIAGKEHRAWSSTDPYDDALIIERLTCCSVFQPPVRKQALSQKSVDLNLTTLVSDRIRKYQLLASFALNPVRA